jgi:RNA polymerase sigma-70 factor (ECF subfamily)
MPGHESAAIALPLRGFPVGARSRGPEEKLNSAESQTGADREWIRRIAAGDEAALTDLYAAYGGPMYAYAFRLTGRAAAAEDVLQECLLAVWRSAGRFRGESRVLTWLLGIVHHKAMDAVGKRRMESSPDKTGDGLPSQDPRPDERFMKREQSSLLRESMARLPLALRSALDLIFFQGLSLEEAAEVSDCPIGTIKSRLHNAKLGLRRILEENGLSAEEIR